MTSDCYVLEFLRRNVNGKHLICFQSETSVFISLRRSVDGAKVLHHLNFVTNPFTENKKCLMESVALDNYAMTDIHRQ